MSEVTTIYNSYIEPLEMVINTTYTGSSTTDYNQFSLPILSSSECDFVVDWGDGSNETITDGSFENIVHTYSNPGEYTIKITGKLKGLYFKKSGSMPAYKDDLLKLVEVKKWGKSQLNSNYNQGGFNQAYNLKSLPSASPIFLNGDKSLSSGFFANTSVLSADTTMWGTVDEPITGSLAGLAGSTSTSATSNDLNLNFYAILEGSLNNVFSWNDDFNSDLSNWDTTNVTSMSSTFYISSSFNQDIGNWDVSNTTSFSRFFTNAESFNNGGSPSISGWTTSGVTFMNGVFQNAYEFNQPIGSWDVSNVTSMNSMFLSANKFNQPIGNWDTSNVTDMFRMFFTYGVHEFDQDIGSWDVSNITNMDRLFAGSVYRTGPSNYFNNGGSDSIRNWDVSNVTNMEYMFQAGTFNQPIGDWDVSKVTNMTAMFNQRHPNTHPFNQDLSNWNVSACTRFDAIFERSSMDVDNIENLNNWNVSSNCVSLQSMFTVLQTMDKFNPVNWDISNVTNLKSMFYQTNISTGATNISLWDTSSVTTLESMFRFCPNFNIDISSWDTSSVTNMNYIFQNNYSFNQYLGDWNIQNVTNMSLMLDNTNLSVENYSNTLIGWASQAPNIQTSVTLGASGLKYNAYAQEAHDLLTGTYGWTITDGGLDEDIVMSGMVFSVDAGYTTSYTSGSTTWYDLVGDNDGTLINGPTFDEANGGSIVFDGTNDRILLNPTEFTSGSQSWTILLWVNLDNLTKHIHFTGVPGKHSINWAPLSHYGAGYPNNYKQSWWDSNGWRYSLTPLSENTWHQVGLYYDGTNTIGFILDDQYDNTTQGGSSFNPIAYIGSLGYRQHGNDRYLDGKISIVKIYNRMLTPSEILQNYNAQKGRYGL